MASFILSLGPDAALASNLLYISIHNGCPHTVKALLDTKLLDVNEPFLNDVSQLNHPIETIMAQKSKDISRRYSEMTLLFAAALFSRYDIMDILMEAGADINKRGRHAISMKLELPIKAKVTIPVALITFHESTILHYASFTHNVELVQFLVQRGADINARDYSDCTPLHYAVSKYNSKQALPTVQYLLQHGADVNAIDGMYQTPLFFEGFEMHYKHYKHIEIDEHTLSTNASAMFQCLRDYGADLFAKDWLGNTLLHSYAGRDKSFFWAALPDCDANQIGLLVRKLIPTLCLIGYDDDAIKRVLQYTDVNQPDGFGQTSLFDRNVIGRKSVVEMLLQNGLDINHKDKFGFTALVYCRDNKMIEFIRSHGGINTTSRYSISTDRFRAARKADIGSTTSDVIDASDIPEVVSSQPEKISCLLTEPGSGFYHERNTELQEALQIRNCVSKLVTFLCNAMSEEDPALAVGDIQLSGSVGETTKVHKPDEFDFVLELTHFSSWFKYPTVRQEKDSLTQLQSHDDISCLPVYIRRYLESNGILNFKKLLNRFNICISKILSEPSIWEHFPHLIYEGIGGKMNLAMKFPVITIMNINHFNVTWHGRVYPRLSISIDIVAGLPFLDWFPPICRPHPLLQKNGCFVVAKRSEHASEDQRDFLGRFSFSWSECEMMLAMPVALRKGYMLAKHMRHPSICPAIRRDGKEDTPVSKVVSSYLLKNCIMEEYTKLKDGEVDVHVDENLASIINYAHRIYVRLGVAFKTGCLPMFFIPSQNLLSAHTKEEMALASEYCKLIRQLLRDPDCVKGKLRKGRNPSVIEF